MIRLRRLPEPQVLCKNKDKWQKTYLAERAADPAKRPSSRQYAHRDIVDALRGMSFHKCFYCEQSTKDSRAEVDHHVEVAVAPERAFDWHNLYLSCPDCNRKKLDHAAVSVVSCLDPCNETVDPVEHLTFEDELIRPRAASISGRETIRKYRLDRAELDQMRLRQIKYFHQALHRIEDRQKTEGRREFDEKEKELLQRFRQPEYPFSLMFRVYLEPLGL